MNDGSASSALLEEVRALSETRQYWELDRRLATYSRVQLMEEPELGYYLAVAWLHLRRSKAGLQLTNELAQSSRYSLDQVLARRIELLRSVFFGREGDLISAEKSVMRCMECVQPDLATKFAASATNSLGVILSQKGEWQQAIPQLQRAQTIYRLLGDSFGIATTYHNIGLASRYLGRFEDSERAFLAAERYYRTDGTPEEAVFSEAERSLAVAGLGDTKRALKMAQRALEHCRRLNNAELTAETIRIFAIVLRESGDLLGARVHFDEALTRARSLQNTQLVAEVRLEAGILELRSGSVKVAGTHLARAIRFFRRTGATGFERLAREHCSRE